MKKLSKLTESVWSDIRDRANGISIKRENGRKVNSCIGDIILKKPDCDYDTLIRDIIQGDDTDLLSFNVNNVRDLSYSTEELKNIRNWEAPYAYLVFDGLHGTSLIASFTSYSEIIDFELDDNFKEEYIEDDYISICRAIAELVKSVGNCIEFAPRRDSIILDFENKHKNAGDYSTHTLLLIKESDVFYWECENETYVDYLRDFKEDIEEEFPELKDTDFICWTYQNGCNIALPLYNISNLINFKKYKEFTQNWFSV